MPKNKKSFILNNQEGSDPDPIALLTVCFGGISMISGIAATLLNLLERRRQTRQVFQNQREQIAEIFIAMDNLESSGIHLRESIEAIEHDAILALTFLRRPDSISRRSSRQQGRMAIGYHSIHINGATREMWNLLVDDVCTNIKLVNRFVLDYSDQLSILFEKLRTLDTLQPEFNIERQILESSFKRVQEFRMAIAKFQALTERTPLSRAETVFNNLCNEAYDLILYMHEIIYRIRRNLR